MNEKVSDALKVLRLLGFPAAQQNEQTALCLLAILNLTANKKWKQAEAPLIGITPIIEWIGENYGKKYAPNTRETIRKNAVHKFVDAGIALPNPDDGERPVTSPRTVYQIEPAALNLLRIFKTRKWDEELRKYLSTHASLVSRYAKERELGRIPIRIDSNQSITISPGKHSQLIRSIIEEFGPRFVPNGELLYVGDTGAKWVYFDEKVANELGIRVERHGIMPDVIIYYRERNWLILAEAVTTKGPVDGKRQDDLKKLFGNCSAGLVFVTAFPSRKKLAREVLNIAWETEVWSSEEPSHLIHFNGVRFLGPYPK